MTQNKIKSFGLNIDEEKDAFLTFLNKKVRNNRKKLDQIDELSKREKTTLKAEQLEKINSKNEVKENMKYIDNVRLMYYEALKTAKDEGKLPPQEATSTIQTQEPAQIIETKQEQIAQPTIDLAQLQREKEEEISRTTHQNLTRIINLAHFAQFFRDQSKVQEFRQAYDSHRERVGVDSVPDFDIFYDFYAKIFTFSESDKFVKIDDKTKGSLHELESYINAAEQPALRNKSYGFLQSVVESVANSQFFRNHKADIETVQSKAPVEVGAIGSIGSELKKAHEQPQKLGVPAEAERLVPNVGSTQQDKHRSPEKEVKVEQRHQPEPVKASAQKEEARKDWGNVEDEEEEEEEEDEEEEEEYEGEGEEGQGEAQQGEEEQKQEKAGDDGWSTVKSKLKEKKDEPVNRGGRGGYRGRGGRGQGRGGYRKPRPEGEQGGEGQQREYRPRRRPEGEEIKEGQEGQTGEYKPRGGYRGGYKGGNREGGEGQTGEFKPRGEYRGGYRGGYKGGNREGGEYQPREGQRGGQQGGPRREYTQKPQQETERKETPAA